MKNICAAILAICLGTFGNMAALAQNTAYGTGALQSDTTGYFNSAFGINALEYNTTGTGNTAVGQEALENSNANFDTATGMYALGINTSGEYETATGFSALENNTTGSYNAATGAEALWSNTTGSYDTATGFQALETNSTGEANTATGYQALADNTGGYDNLAEGVGALFNNTTGVSNTAAGMNALNNNSTGDYNIGVGFQAGYAVTGSYNIDIGSQGTSSDSDTIRIGTPGTQTSFFAAGVDGVTVSSGVPVYINSSGQLGTVNSSIRFKEDIHDMADASSAIFRLRPVTYRYKQPYADGSKPIDYGLIAEEVAAVYPDLVVKDASGQIQTVQYQKLTPMLLNELQKQHLLLEQMENTLEQQNQTIQLLKAQQTETVQGLEKRLAALEAAQPSARLEARVAAQ